LQIWKDAIKLRTAVALLPSRSVAQAAPALSNEILENVQRDVLASLDKGSNLAPKTRKMR
jgi:TetR/AcrR family transcriptional repressor of nem operon